MAESESTPDRGGWEHPPAYVRIAVLVGLATLLLGLSGLFWLESGPPTPAFVRVLGVAEDLKATPEISFEVEATWEDGDGELRGEAGTLGREPDVWLFYDAPVGTEVTLIVYRRNEAERRAVAQGTQPLARGRILELPLLR